jgi:serine/threonine protein kinase
LFLATELWDDAQSLYDVKKRTRELGIGEAVSCSIKILDGLAFMHEMGFVHRDITPRSIMVTETPDGYCPRIARLGRACSYKGEDQGSECFFPGTRPGRTFGTMPFVPPEQVEDARHVRPPGDVFATGATLYNMLTGQSICSIRRGQGQRRRVIHGRIVPIRERDQAIPESLAAVVDRALSPAPADRYQDAGAFKMALEAAVC